MKTSGNACVYDSCKAQVCCVSVASTRTVASQGRQGLHLISTCMSKPNATHVRSIGLVQGQYCHCSMYTCKLIWPSGTSAHSSLSFIKTRTSPRQHSEDHGMEVCKKCSGVSCHMAWLGMSLLSDKSHGRTLPQCRIQLENLEQG